MSQHGLNHVGGWGKRARPFSVELVAILDDIRQREVERDVFANLVEGIGCV